MNHFPKKNKVSKQKSKNHFSIIISCRYEDDDPAKVQVKEVRPRCRTKLAIDDMNVGEFVMVNYNYDEPDARGYWYDALITKKNSTRTIKDITATVFVG